MLFAVYTRDFEYFSETIEYIELTLFYNKLATKIM